MVMIKTVKREGKTKQIVVLEEQPSKNPKRPYQVLTDPEGVEYVAKLASMGCTREEIAEDLGVCTDTLLNPRNREKFNRAMAMGHSDFTSSIRNSQYKIMKQGSATMAIFLGKNYLGQTDKVEVTDANAPSPLTEFAKALSKYKDDE